jgi:glutathione S-transferase
VSLLVLGLAFKRHALSVFSDSDAMRRINPLGRIPSLIHDDGEMLIDSAAILDHLDELVGPDRPLVPRSGVSRRSMPRPHPWATAGLEQCRSRVFLPAAATGARRALSPCRLLTEPLGVGSRFLQGNPRPTRASRRGVPCASITIVMPTST